MPHRAIVFLTLAFAISARAQTPAPDPAAVARGADLYGRCVGCHSLDRNRTGPRHCDVFGRPAATQPGFSYSTAMRQSGIVWDAAALDAFLTAPRSVVPRTRMTVAGIADPGARADLIAFLKEARPCPD